MPHVRRNVWPASAPVTLCGKVVGHTVWPVFFRSQTLLPFHAALLLQTNRHNVHCSLSLSVVHPHVCVSTASGLSLQTLCCRLRNELSLGMCSCKPQGELLHELGKGESVTSPFLKDRQQVKGSVVCSFL